MINRRDAIQRRRSALMEELALERAACRQRIRRDVEFLKFVGVGMRAVNSQTGRPLLRAAALTGLTFALAWWRKKSARKQA